MSKRVAIFSAAGVGDGLIMMIASHAFKQAGYDVTTFNNHLSSFGKWFKDCKFENRPPPEEYEEKFQEFDIIVVQHENSYQAKGLAELEKRGRRIILFYNNYRKQKHPPLEKDHFAFDEKTTMVKNISEAMQKILGLDEPPKEIGMRAPKGLTHKKHPKRVIIHPSSSMGIKNWTPKKFISLGRKLKKMGYLPVITTSPKERPDWAFAEKYGIEVPSISKLSELAELLYESGYFIGNDSGPGHLASYLQIPTLILAGKSIISHWRPDWLRAHVVMPPKWAPNMKGPLRLRENKWQLFVPVFKVIKEFSKL